jgi:hypothetical protein
MTRVPPLAASEAAAPHCRPGLTSLHRVALERALARWSTRLGEASTDQLRAQAEQALAERAWVGPVLADAFRSSSAAADADDLCTQLERAHEAHFGRTALKAERADDIAREHARTSGPALAGYYQKWERAIARLQRAHPQRWQVPGLSDDEVRDAVTLRLIELIVAPPADPPRGRPGKPWGLCVAQSQLGVLRRSFRLTATPTDFAAVPLLERAPSQEERWLALEADQRRALAAERAHRQLNRPQRSWLAAMKHSAEDGGFFESSDQLNLSAASQKLGRNRSSAHRAYRALQACFQRELGRLE